MKKKRWTWAEFQQHGGKAPVEPEAVEDPRQKPGRCDGCGHGEFGLAIVKRHLLRNCKQCGRVIDTDNGMEVVRKGESA